MEARDTPLATAERQFELSAERIADQERRLEATQRAGDPASVRLASDLLDWYRYVQSHHCRALDQERVRTGRLHG